MMGAGKEPTTSLACYLQDCIGNVMALKSMRRNPKVFDSAMRIASATL